MSSPTAAPDNTAPTSVATYPWWPLPDEAPDEGDVLTSTQVLGMGQGMEDKNELAEMVSQGFKIHRVKVITLEKDCGFALVNLWREQTDEERKSRRVRSKVLPG